MKKVDWKEVSIFYVLAVAISAPFRLGWLNPEKDIDLLGGLSVFFVVLRGIGPAIAFCIVVYILKSKVVRTTTFLGKIKWASILAASIIPLGLIVTGVPNQMNLNEHYFGLIYGLTLVAYALGEEYGWRGYLQEALKPIPELYRILMIAVLWYLWHLNFFLPGTDLQTHGIHFFALVIGSWGLLKITDRTHSILFASAVHLSFNILSDVRGNITGRLIILGIAIVAWIYLLKGYRKLPLLKES